MKKIKKIWNNRKFRTFFQTLISTITTYFMATNVFEIDSKAIISLLITAIATGLSAVMPLINDEEE